MKTKPNWVFILALVIPAFVAMLSASLFTNSAFADAHHINWLFITITWTCAVWVVGLITYRFYLSYKNQ